MHYSVEQFSSFEIQSLDVFKQSIKCPICLECEFDLRCISHSQKKHAAFAYICQPCANIIFKGSLNDLKTILSPKSPEDTTEYLSNIQKKRFKRVTILKVKADKYSCPQCNDSSNLFERFFSDDHEQYLDGGLDTSDFTVLTTCKSCEAHYFEFYGDNNIEDIEVFMSHDLILNQSQK